MKVIDIGVGKIGVAESLEDEFPKSGLDAALVAATANRKVNLSHEISGTERFAASGASLTLGCDYPVLCGCVTDFGSGQSVSVMTFARGRLVDIADRTVNLRGGYVDGDTIKIFRLRRFDIGLLVDTDILFADNWRRINSLCKAVACIGISGSDADFAYIPMLGSMYGLPYVAAFGDGTLLWSNP